MKLIKIKSMAILVLALMITGGTSSFAQRGQGMKSGAGYGMGFGLNLTEDQQNQMKEMRIAHLKDVQPVRDQLVELKAHQRTLMNAEKPDQKSINKNIDEMTKLQNKLMKMGSEFRLKVTSILTDEQKVLMQSRQGKGRGHRMGMGMRGGRGACMMNNGTNKPGRGTGYHRFGYRGNSPRNAPEKTVN